MVNIAQQIDTFSLMLTLLVVTISVASQSDEIY